MPELSDDLAFLFLCLLGRDDRFLACGSPVVVHCRLGDDCRVAIELGVGEQPGGLGEVEDVEEELAVVVPQPGAATDDLLELHDGVHHAGEDDVLAGRGVHAGGQELGRREDDGRGRLHVLEPAQVTDADVALVGGHPADIVGVLPDQVGVEVVQLPAHLVGVLLVHAEDDRLGEAVGPLEEVGDAAGDGLGAGAEGDDPLEVLGLVLLVGDLPPVAVKFARVRSPAEGIVGGDDAVDAVGGEEAVLDTLAQGVDVDRLAEVGVGVHVRVALGRGGHPELEGGLEVVQDLPPGALVSGATPVALVHDDQVEEVGRILTVEPRAAFVLGDRLVDGEIHLPPLADFAVGDLEPRIAEGDEVLVLRVVHEDVAVGEVEDSRFSLRLPLAVPHGVPQHPAYLERNERLARARRHREQHPLSPPEDRLHDPMDGDLLVVAEVLLGLMVAGRKELHRCPVVR